MGEEKRVKATGFIVNPHLAIFSPRLLFIIYPVTTPLSLYVGGAAGALHCGLEQTRIET